MPGRRIAGVDEPQQQRRGGDAHSRRDLGGLAAHAGVRDPRGGDQHQLLERLGSCVAVSAAMKAAHRVADDRCSAPL
jgi:hypothetical protein